MFGAEPDLGHVYVNPAFLRMSGYGEAEILGKKPDMLYGLKTKREVVERFEEHRQSGRSFVGEMMHYRKDGSSFLMEVRADPVRNGADVTHWVMIYR